MSAGLDPGTLVEILVASGLLTALSTTIQWITSGRGRQRVDNAKIVQGMALDLLQPLHKELDECRRETAEARAETARARIETTAARVDLQLLRDEIEQVLGYAIIAHELLLGNPNAPAPPPAVLKHTAG